MVRAETEVLALIQARGGSRGLPGKNIRLLAGQPLIAYSIAAALQSSHVTRVLLSTDDPEIARIGASHGAEVPFLRPSELAGDRTEDFPVIAHALKWLEQHEEYQPDIVVQLRPTSPLRPPELIDECLQELRSHQSADSVRTVMGSRENPFKMWFIQAGYLVPLLSCGIPEAYNKPRQALPQTYWQTGHLDVIRVQTIQEKGSLTGNIVLPHILDAAYGIDIDSAEDLEKAERVLDREDLPLVRPSRERTGDWSRQLERVRLVVLDFDGVLTDNRVWVTEEGLESVACNRGDGLGLELLGKAGLEIFVLSTEKNPVVLARCRKLGISCIQGIGDKLSKLRELSVERNLEMEQIVFVGNDRNDVACLRAVGCGVAVADAHPSAHAAADFILKSCGGHGAVRELCDRLLEARSHELTETLEKEEKIS